MAIIPAIVHCPDSTHHPTLQDCPRTAEPETNRQRKRTKSIPPRPPLGDVLETIVDSKNHELLRQSLRFNLLQTAVLG
jgi:hypothetical protein